MKPNDRRILRIKLQNLLSFGPESRALELGNLNVLIGPNSSGKSNLIEALSLLRATPISAAASQYDFRGVLRRGGGVDEWIWKGGRAELTSIEVLFDEAATDYTLRHCLSFSGGDQGFRLREETIDKGSIAVSKSRNDQTRDDGRSVLDVLRGSERFPEFAELTVFYEGLRIYRDWVFGRNTVFRSPQPADVRPGLLEEDFSNLALFLSRFSRYPKVRLELVGRLKDLYEGLTDFQVVAEGGTIYVVFHEGDISIPARRLSDGTLRYLCLLAILCDPSPPPLICIEEPELGLHPDILPKLADLLLAASERTQLIVTTHSDVLIDSLTEHPETVIVCEKHEGQTQMRRLEKNELTPWLENYRLGQLWSTGQLGGNRW